ncbi:complex III assembly factor LYRM7 [Centruroides vittatus]|uniref:complex III assembly factor LYRM7 n=1 Tax=Centruroides vittatus TaxID=120091 RepID=UPI00350F9413
MNGVLREKVLACYRSLYRTRRTVFEGDVHALQISAKKLRDEFRKNISVNDPKRIEELLEVGQNVESLLKKHVVQLRLNDKGNYEMKMREEIELEDNMPYKMTNSEKLKPDIEK